MAKNRGVAPNEPAVVKMAKHAAKVHQQCDTLIAGRTSTDRFRAAQDQAFRLPGARSGQANQPSPFAFGLRRKECSGCLVGPSFGC
jgi:hypothetical protein